ncbi:MAG: hypothetical protein PHS41_01530 [Victivallaceae bacterium]|nr:hypothetical protein [Victivallaceae bacterium]
MSKIIQFIHPGAERTPFRGENWKPCADHEKGYCGWTPCKKSHTRKFLLCPGQYFDWNTQQVVSAENLRVWCEAEWNTKVLALPSPSEGEPKWEHTFTQLENNCKNKINTDPYIFGETFKYSNCRQKHFSELQNLSPGDMILFGSQKQNRTQKGAWHFMLDTVFVVSDQRFTFNALKPIQCELNITDMFRKTVLARQADDDCSSWRKSCNMKGDCRLYFGASYAKQYNKMYSFAPVKLGLPGTAGYSRMTLDSLSVNGEDNCIAKGQLRGIKYTEVKNIAAYWDALLMECRNKGFYPGVLFSEPQK